MIKETQVLFVVLLLAMVVPGCGEDAGDGPGVAADMDVLDGESDAPDGSDVPDEPDVPEASVSIGLEVERERTAGLSPVVLTVTLSAEGVPLEGVVPEVEAQRGVVGDVEALGGNQYRFVLTPEETGEHPFVIRAGDAELERTALVLRDVGQGLGQPMSVPGLVNTAGYEDGVTITPDGRYLFVQTGPAHFSGLVALGLPRAQGGCGGNRAEPEPCEHPWVNQTIGPYDAPERPGFFTGRIDTERGTFLHNSLLYQVPEGGTPNFPIPTMFYGFERQPDGSFTKPFYVAFEDGGDAILNPFGLSFMMHGDGTATILFSLLDPLQDFMVTQVDHNMDGQAVESVPSGSDVYTTRITLGQDNILGRYEPGANPLEIVRADFPPERLGFDAQGSQGLYGGQGNAHLFQGPMGEVNSVWTDDERDSDPNTLAYEDHEDLSVYVLEGAFPQGPWTKVVLPEPVNTPAQQIQPFFTGQGLLYTQDTSLYYSAYGGEHTAEGYANSDNWATPVAILSKDTDAGLGRIVAIGEPTVGFFEGRVELYFVYASVRDVDDRLNFPDLDLQAGMVTIDP